MFIPDRLAARRRRRRKTAPTPSATRRHRAPPQRPAFWPETFNDLFELAAQMALVGAVMFGAFQFWQQRADAKVGRTLDLIEQFDAEEYAAARARLDEFATNADAAWQKQDQATKDLIADKQGAQNRLLVTAVNDQGEGLPPRPAPAFERVVSFIGGLQVCIEQKACDAPTAHAFLDRYSTGVWDRFSPVIDDQRRQQRPGYGSEMERFVRAARRLDNGRKG